MQDQSGRLGQAADAALASRATAWYRRGCSRGERWARLRRSLWQPPRPHGEQPRERVVSPLELFYDLAVVVLVAQAAHRLADLPLTAAVAAMGAAMVSLVEHAQDGRTPAATASVLGAGAAVVLGATMLLRRDPALWTATPACTAARLHLHRLRRGLPRPRRRAACATSLRLSGSSSSSASPGCYAVARSPGERIRSPAR